jgi:hypothetical protein
MPFPAGKMLWMIMPKIYLPLGVRLLGPRKYDIALSCCGFYALPFVKASYDHMYYTANTFHLCIPKKDLAKTHF